MTTTTKAAYLANKKLSDLQARADKLLDQGKREAALELKPAINQAQREAARADALLIADNGAGDLWEAAAMALTGEHIKILWERTTTGSNGQAANSYPLTIRIDPYLPLVTTYNTFLHECGHVIDFRERDPLKATYESLEARADELAGKLEAYAESHCMDYDRPDLSGVQVRLLALINKGL